jgi:DeoR family transcriptional regulator, glycerol-3-phosphate regulon repressor
MLTSQRERAILEHLTETGSARIDTLARALDVTDETVRRNVRRLEAAGMVTKVHGGVHLRDWRNEPSFAQRYVQNSGAKRRIAAAVADMVQDGASIFLDVGSTTAYVAQALRTRRELSVVTNSLAVAQALAGQNGNRVFMAGGELRSHDGGAFGAEALDFIRQFRLDIAVISATAIDAQSGFLLQDLREAEFARAAIAQAGEVWVAADSSKFDRMAPVRIAEPQAFRRLVCDGPPPQPLAAFLLAAGVEISVAP